MTEADWFAATDPAPLLRYVEPRFTDRLRLLFMAGCCRGIWDLLINESFRRVVETAEDRADRVASEEELHATSWQLDAPGSEPQVRRDGRVEFDQPPFWLEQAFHAVAVIAQRQYLAVAESCENAAAHCAGDAVAERHPLHREVEQLRDVAQKAQKLDRETEKRMQSLTNEIWSAGAAERISRAATERAAQTDLVRCLVGNPFREVAIDPAWRTSTVIALTDGIDADRAYDRLPILADALEDAGCADADVLAHCRGPCTHTKGCWVIEKLLAQEKR